MCAKDEEREPLQPDGNNKDVKVITTIFFCKSESEIVSLKSESEKVFLKNGHQVINELIEDLTKLDLVGERIPLTRMHNNNKERRHEFRERYTTK